MNRLFPITISVLAVVGAALALSQSTYDDDQLAVKRRFAENEIAALSEPFRGVTTSSGVERGLFAIRSTGVCTEPIRKQAVGSARRP